MKFSTCDRNNFEAHDEVIEKLQIEYSEKAEFIISDSVKVYSSSELEMARDLASVEVKIYQIKNLFFIFQHNSSLDELALMFKAALTDSEIKEFQELKAASTYDYAKAIEFLAKNTF